MANFKNYLWPDIQDIESAKKAAHMGAGCALLVGVATGVVTVLHMNGVKFISGWSTFNFLDAGIFLVAGLFLLRCSRLAALTALLFYVGGQVVMAQAGGYRFNVLPILFTLHFIAGVRGSFEYHSFKKHEFQEASSEQPLQPEGGSAETLEQSEQPAPAVKSRKGLWVILVFLLLAGAGGAGYYLVILKPSADTEGSSNVISHAISAGSEEEAAVSEESSGQRTFRLKTGKTVRGHVVMEDEIYYTVETFGGKQEIVIKEDLAE